MIVYLILLIVFFLDQLTKHLVRSNIALGDSIPGEGFFRLVHYQNTGAAFGFFEDARPLLITVGVIALLIIFWIVLYHKINFLENTWGRISLGLMAGGTLGNLFERIYYGSVTDFLKAGPWPAFNVADSSMVVGSIILVFLFLRSEQLRSA